MLSEYKAPKFVPAQAPNKVFLAGAIDMGSAVDWQTQATNALLLHGVTVVNPRRDDWDSTWQQTPDDPQFREQVEWELDQMEAADAVLLVLTKDSKAPISLLELGLLVRQPKLVVVCEPGFYRRGNVQIVCRRYETNVADNLADGVRLILASLDLVGPPLHL